jgi:polar amino acid transport system permease protein
MIDKTTLRQPQSLVAFLKSERRKPLYRRLIFVILWFLGIILVSAIFMPLSGPLTTLQKVIGGLIFLFSLVWSGIVLADHNKPFWLHGLAALFILFEVIFAIYAYSGANFGKLGHVFFNQTVMEGQWPLMLEGLMTTVQIALYSILFSTLLGLILAILRATNNTMLKNLIVAYLTFFRTMPAIVVLMFIYFGLPSMNLRFSAFTCSVLVLSMSGGAYVSEIFRAGIEAIHHTQIEAARALGLTFWKTMYLVIMPQAFRIVIPPLTNQWIGTLKETAICSLAAITELLKAAQIVSTWKANPTPLLAAAAIYLAAILPLTRFANYLEVRMKKGRRV